MPKIQFSATAFKDFIEWGYEVQKDNILIHSCHGHYDL